jgi:hypothetical protein
MESLETIEILAKASPRNPNVPIDSKSEYCDSLLVACRCAANGKSTREIPDPLSETLKEDKE